MPFLIFLLWSVCGFAQGGPPLVTDDPGTPGDKHWEINSALQYSSSPQVKTLLLPAFDINYGYLSNLQFNINKSYISNFTSASSASSGSSLASLAVKWRFVDEEKAGIAISTYPRIDFHDGLASQNGNINQAGSRFFLPIELSKEFGKIGVNPEIGYACYSQTPSEWLYGIAAAYEISKDNEVLVELHGRSRVGTADHELLYNLGTRLAISSPLSFIGSAGRTFTAYSDSLPAWNIYAGVQLRLSE